MALREVTQLFVTPNQAVYEVEVDSEDGAVEEIGTTAEHPFWVEELGWVPASRLQPGDRLVSNTGGWLEVRQVRGSPRTETVYNFEVAEYHTYFVGELGVWVHNLCEEGRSRLLENLAESRKAREASSFSGGSTRRGSAGLPVTLQQQKALAQITREVREELVNDFGLLARELSPAQIDAIASEPLANEAVSCTALETRVATKVQSLADKSTGSAISRLTWTGRTNAPQDFIGDGGFGIDITGNSWSSVRVHTQRSGIDAVVTYDSIPSDLGARFIRWLEEQQ